MTSGDAPAGRNVMAVNVACYAESEHIGAGKIQQAENGADFVHACGHLCRRRIQRVTVVQQFLDKNYFFDVRQVKLARSSFGVNRADNTLFLPITQLPDGYARYFRHLSNTYDDFREKVVVSIGVFFTLTFFIHSRTQPVLKFAQ